MKSPHPCPIRLSPEGKEEPWTGCKQRGGRIRKVPYYDASSLGRADKKNPHLKVGPMWTLTYSWTELLCGANNLSHVREGTIEKSGTPAGHRAYCQSDHLGAAPYRKSVKGSRLSWRVRDRVRKGRSLVIPRYPIPTPRRKPHWLHSPPLTTSSPSSPPLSIWAPGGSYLPSPS